MRKATSKTPALKRGRRALALHGMLDAAARILNASDPPDFSMRDLCEAAGVSFATPFNHFGSKTGVVHALAMRIFADVHNRYARSNKPGDAIDRVFAMAAVGTEVWLENPAVNRYISSSLMVAGNKEHPEQFLEHSCKLWLEALGSLDGLEGIDNKSYASSLSLSLAVAFRGTMALWIGGEISDSQFAPLLQAHIACLLLGFAPSHRRPRLYSMIHRTSALRRKRVSRTKRTD
jgi:AcrR family transcriptional regulator